METKIEKHLIILSGGMDSTVALYKFVTDLGKDNVVAISFDYGSKHNDQEHLMAKKSCEKLGVKWDRVDLNSLTKHLKSNLLKGGGDIPEGHYAESNMKKTVVPFRNGIMLSIACGIAESNGCKKVVIGNHYGDHAIYPDCRGVFIDSMNEAMAYGTYENINISSPFCKLTKTDIAQIGKILKVNWEETYSCYKGEEEQCGVCSTCFERREAFYLAKVTDPTTYKDKTPIEALIKKYEKGKNG